ncbi:unnamed protein product, partial [Brassica oleracea var. botrytis]
MIRRQLRRPQLRSAIRQRRGGDDLSLRQIVVELSPCRENYSDDDSDDHTAWKKLMVVTSSLR